jgi:hypothetical protein
MGGKVAKAKAKKPSPHTAKLDKLEAQLARTTDAEALGALAREFHSVSYSLGHDISAIISNPGIVDRATRDKVDANERAAAAYERAGNIRHALFHLYEGLDAFPGAADRERLAASIATLLDTHGPASATQLRTELAALPVVEDEAGARQQFYNVLRRIKGTIDWDRLPRGS